MLKKQKSKQEKADNLFKTMTCEKDAKKQVKKTDSNEKQKNLMGSELESKKKNASVKLPKKFGAFLVIVLMIMLLVSIFILSRMVTSDNRFYRDVERGVEKGWNISNGDFDIQLIEGKKQTEFIKCEYDSIYKYINVNFKDKTIENAAREYISALQGCKNAIERYNPEGNYNEFWQEFSPYYGQRIQSLCKLYTLNKRAFESLRKKHADKLNRLLLNGWAIEKTKSIEFVKTKDDKGHEIFQANVLNDSGIDMEFFNLEILLLSGKNDIIDTTSAYVDNWPKNTSKELQFYKTSKKVKAYKINGVTCK